MSSINTGLFGLYVTFNIQVKLVYVELLVIVKTINYEITGSS